VDDVVNDDELVKDANCISLKERPMEDVEGDEFTSNFYNILRKTRVYLLKTKGEVFNKFKAYKTLVEIQTDMNIKTLRFDNGREFVSKKPNDFLHECGIQ
jgi:hypothetical protein